METKDGLISRIGAVNWDCSLPPETYFGGYAARSCFKPTATSDPQALLLEYTGTNNRKGQISVVW